MNLSPKARVIGMIVDEDLSVSEFLCVAKFFLGTEYIISPKIPEPTTAPGFNPKSMAEMINHITAGRKIDAIKIYRAATGMYLKEAKEAVEDLMLRIS